MLRIGADNASMEKDQRKSAQSAFYFIWQLCNFLTRFSVEGGSHYQALAYGRLANKIKKIGKLQEIECGEV